MAERDNAIRMILLAKGLGSSFRLIHSGLTKLA
jgi:hypothetical protein